MTRTAIRRRNGVPGSLRGDGMLQKLVGILVVGTVPEDTKQ